MGLLDDAIREHLELKRSSGADAGGGRAPGAGGAGRAAAVREFAAARGARPAAAEPDAPPRTPRPSTSRRPPDQEPAAASPSREPTSPRSRLDEPDEVDVTRRPTRPAPTSARARARGAAQPPPQRQPATRTCWRRRRTSSRRRRSTTGCGSSRSRRATSTSHTDRRAPVHAAWLDVFTDRPLAGNGLAVVHDADALSDATMHAFARETRLSETSFVQSPPTAAPTTGTGSG